MQTYTVVAPSGEIINKGLSAADALDEMLLYDGRDYRILNDPDDSGEQTHYFWLEICGSHNAFGGPGPFKQAWANNKPVACYADDESEAIPVFLDMISKAWAGTGSPDCMTDAEYIEVCRCDPHAYEA